MVQWVKHLWHRSQLWLETALCQGFSQKKKKKKKRKKKKEKKRKKGRKEGRKELKLTSLFSSQAPPPPAHRR